MTDDIFTVELHGLELRIEGNINPGETGDREQPPISKSVDINKVFYKDIEVSDLLNLFGNDWLEVVTNKILDNE